MKASKHYNDFDAGFHNWIASAMAVDWYEKHGKPTRVQGHTSGHDCIPQIRDRPETERRCIMSTVNPCPLCGSGHLETWCYDRDCSMHGAAGGVACKTCGHKASVKGDDRDDTGKSCLNAAIMIWNDQIKYTQCFNGCALRKAVDCIVRGLEGKMNDSPNTMTSHEAAILTLCKKALVEFATQTESHAEKSRPTNGSED